MRAWLRFYMSRFVQYSNEFEMFAIFQDPFGSNDDRSPSFLLNNEHQNHFNKVVFTS